MVKITDDGEANFYGLATEKNWLARVQFNGELTAVEQARIMHVFADALNTIPENLVSSGGKI